MSEQLINVNIDVLKERLAKKLNDYPNICKCEICQNDMLTLALNKLSAHYARTSEGMEYQKIRVEAELSASDEFIDNVIKTVAKNPRHD